MLVFKRDVQDMPAEEKRTGGTETSILLALPGEEEFEPVLKGRDTFASLPIENCGVMVGTRTPGYSVRLGVEQILCGRPSIAEISRGSAVSVVRRRALAWCGEDALPLFVLEDDMAADAFTSRFWTSVPGQRGDWR
ncbi:hypothetical protein LTR27_004727 [Elasticomyces elasticus]|nr:hypothetical protein LTR27_004727 [Elasticomyces elasticus]